MEARTLEIVDGSLHRCSADPDFLERFYERFLASSPEVREKFVDTDFVRQKRALKASLHLMLLAAEDEERGPELYLRDLAARHGQRQLDIGAHLYDLWLDSLLDTVRQCDPECSNEVLEAWERVMAVGVRYLLRHYRKPPPSSLWQPSSA